MSAVLQSSNQHDWLSLVTHPRKGEALRELVPPRVPEELAPLEEAITLLGAFSQSQGKLRLSRLERLSELLGGRPDLETAVRWKRMLKDVRNDLVELDEV